MQLSSLVYHYKLSMVNETYQCPVAGRMKLLIRGRADVFLDVMENRLKGQTPERVTPVSNRIIWGRWEWGKRLFVDNLLNGTFSILMLKKKVILP